MGFALGRLAAIEPNIPGLLTFSALIIVMIRRCFETATTLMKGYLAVAEISSCCLTPATAIIESALN
jgi:hypothetical protein